MRSTLAGNGCSVTVQPNATAIVYYDTLSAPKTAPWPSFINSVNNQCANVCSAPSTFGFISTNLIQDPLNITSPLYSITPTTPSVTEDILIEFGQNATGYFLWTMNSVSFRANYNNPIFLLAAVGNTSYPQDPQWNVYNFGSNTSIRIVLTNPVGAAHPIHLHGHNFYVIDVGTGTYDGTTVVNPSNPLRRDVEILPGGGYLVLQFEADNPGAWPLHCHIAWHVSAGLYVTVLERPADINKENVPSTLAQTCRDWATFTGEVVVNQIDSGL